MIIERGWSEAATGDVGPWGRWVPLAWAMAADPAGRHVPPRDPHHRSVFEELAAWWAPLLQLSTYAMGWAFPMRGLARWDQMGRPVEDAVLKVVQHWWGARLDDVLAWGQEFTPGAADGPNLASFSWSAASGGASLDNVPPRGTLFHPYDHRQLDRNWVEVWEHPGSNKFHSWGHASVPERDVEPSLTRFKTDSDVASSDGAAQGVLREALLMDRYRGWYRTLLLSGPGKVAGAPGQPPRSRRVEVLVRPVGWLGTYRCSRVTGLWFRCQHHLHMLGNE